jgi:hypothetical protein
LLIVGKGVVVVLIVIVVVIIVIIVVVVVFPAGPHIPLRAALQPTQANWTVSPRKDGNC